MDEPDSPAAKDAVSPLSLVRPITHGDDLKRNSSKRRKLPAWSYEEEYILAKLHSELGTAWASIAERLPGRSATEAKNIWHSTLRSKAPVRRSLLFEYVHAVQGSRDAKTRREAFRSAVKLHGFQRPKRAGSLSRKRYSDESDSEHLPATAPAATAAASVPLPATPPRHVVEVTPTPAAQVRKEGGCTHPPSGQDLPAVMAKPEARPEAGGDKDTMALGGSPGGKGGPGALNGVGLGGGGSTGWSSDGSGSSRYDGGSLSPLANHHTDKDTRAPEPGGVRGSSLDERAPRLSSSCQPTGSNGSPAGGPECTVAAGRVGMKATVARAVAPAVVTDPTPAGGREASAWRPAQPPHPALGYVPTVSATPGAGQGHPSQHMGMVCPWAKGAAPGCPWPAAEAAAATRVAATATGAVTVLEPGCAALQTSVGQGMASALWRGAGDSRARSLPLLRHDAVWGSQHSRLLFRQGRPFEVVTLGLSALQDPELLQCVAAWEVR